MLSQRTRASPARPSAAVTTGTPHGIEPKTTNPAHTSVASVRPTTARPLTGSTARRRRMRRRVSTVRAGVRGAVRRASVPVDGDCGRAWPGRLGACAPPAVRVVRCGPGWVSRARTSAGRSRGMRSAAAATRRGVVRWEEVMVASIGSEAEEPECDRCTSIVDREVRRAAPGAARSCALVSCVVLGAGGALRSSIGAAPTARGSSSGRSCASASGATACGRTPCCDCAGSCAKPSTTSRAGRGARRLRRGAVGSTGTAGAGSSTRAGWASSRSSCGREASTAQRCVRSTSTVRTRAGCASSSFSALRFSTVGTMTTNSTAAISKKAMLVSTTQP